MDDTSKIIRRETEKIQIVIDTRSGYNMQLVKPYFRVRPEDIDPSVLPYDSHEYDTPLYEIGNYSGGSGFVMPFIAFLNLKTPINRWSYELDKQNKRYVNIIQNEIDKVFANDAKKAAMIIDHKSYEETPERYMLRPLLYHESLQSRYNAYPLLSYENDGSWVSKYGWDILNTLRLYDDDVNLESLMTDVNSSTKIFFRNSDPNKITLFGSSGREPLARWGIWEKMHVSKEYNYNT